jgi:hypothetical protein
LIVAGGRGAGQVIDLVHLEPQRVDDVVPDQLEVGPRQQLRDVGLLAGEEVVDADHVVAGVDQAFAQVRSEKPSSASD